MVSELNIRIKVEGQDVRVDLGTELSWFKLPKKEATKLAIVLLAKAGEIPDNTLVIPKKENGGG